MASDKKKKKNKNPTKDEFGDLGLPYRTNKKTLDDLGVYPIMGNSEKKMRVRSWVFSGILAAIALFGITVMVVALMSTSKVNGIQKNLDAMQTPAFKARYTSLGASVIESYYAGGSPPVNLLSSAQWSDKSSTDELKKGSDSISGSSGTGSSNSKSGGPNGGTRVKVDALALLEAHDAPASLPETEQIKDTTHVFRNPRNEILSYTGMIDGKTYTFGVNLLIPDIDNPSGLPYLVSPPTIMPSSVLVNSDIDASKPDVSSPDSKFSEVQLNQASVDTISSWASAYAQNDGTTIKRIAGDNTMNHEYHGVGGFTLTGTPTVEWSYQFHSTAFDSDMIIARVSFDMETPVRKQSSSANDVIQGGGSNGQFSPHQVIDMLLANYSAGTPNIVAWGAGGNWNNLEPYMNAVVIPKEDLSKSSASSTSSSPSNDLTTSSGNGVPGAPSMTPRNTTEQTTTSAKPKPKPTTSRPLPAPAPRR